MISNCSQVRWQYSLINYLSKIDEKVQLSTNQRLKVLHYINTHKEYLFGNKKKGVARKACLAARQSFVDWCKAEEIPYEGIHISCRKSKIFSKSR